MPTHQDRLLNSALRQVLDGLADQAEGPFIVDAEHRDSLGHGILDGLVTCGILRPYVASNSTTCPGCERACVMRVESRTVATGRTAFIVCDKPQDLGRIPVKPQRLDRWYADIGTVARCLSSLLDAPTEPASPIPGRMGHLGPVSIAGADAEIFVAFNPTEAHLAHPFLRSAARPLVLYLALRPQISAPCVDLNDLMIFRDGRLTVRSDVLAAALAAAPTPAAGNRFERNGSMWLISFGGISVHVRHSTGMSYIAELLVRPNEPIPAYDLYARIRTGGRQLHEAGLEASDSRAAATMRSRLNDHERPLSATERVAITKQISRDFGRAGKVRIQGNASEKARQNVHKAIRAALDAIKAPHPALHAHLRPAIKTGSSCAYGPAVPTNWKIEARRA